MSTDLTRTAFIVVDVQNDFTEGGALPVTGGTAVAERIAAHLAVYRDEYSLVVATRDWHDQADTNGGHFHSPDADPDYRDTWPVHCVQGTPGADYHPALVPALTAGTVHVVKGMGAAAYSGFEGQTPDHGPIAGMPLADVLTAHRITHIRVAGLATDYCVAATATDAARLGYPTTVLLGLCAGVAPDTTSAAIAGMAASGITIAPDAPAVPVAA